MKKLLAVLAIAALVAAQAANVPTSLVGEYHGAVNFYDDQVDSSWYAENEHTGWLPLTVKMAKDGKVQKPFCPCGKSRAIAKPAFHIIPC